MHHHLFLPNWWLWGPQFWENTVYLSSKVWPGQSDIHEIHGGIIIFHLQNYLASENFAAAEPIAKFEDWFSKHRFLCFDPLWGMEKLKAIMIHDSKDRFPFGFDTDQTEFSFILPILPHERKLTSYGSLSCQGGAWQHFWPLAAPLISAKVSRTAAIRTPKATISSLARRSYPECQVAHFGQATLGAWFACRLQWKPGEKYLKDTNCRNGPKASKDHNTGYPLTHCFLSHMRT